MFLNKMADKKDKWKFRKTLAGVVLSLVGTVGIVGGLRAHFLLNSNPEYIRLVNEEKKLRDERYPRRQDDSKRVEDLREKEGRYLLDHRELIKEYFETKARIDKEDLDPDLRAIDEQKSTFYRKEFTSPLDIMLSGGLVLACGVSLWYAGTRKE